jgi:hypothetical protein
MVAKGDRLPLWPSGGPIAKQRKTNVITMYEGDSIMRQCKIPLTALAVMLIASLAYADCGCATPVVAAAPTYVTSYAPAAAYEAPVSYTASYAPAYTTYYSPTYNSPTVAYEAPAAYTSYYAPAPTGYTTYYAPPAVSSVAVPYVSYYAPATPYAAYYSPGVAAAPVPYSTYYYGVPGTSIYGTPQVYVPGQPVRNTLRALTP